MEFDIADYPLPQGLHAIPPTQLDLRCDSEIDMLLLHPPPVSGVKNIWFFWHSGYSTMHPYTKRNVRSWHRRLHKLGWTVRVVDKEPSSPLYIGKFIDVHDSLNFPRAFAEGTLEGTYKMQHTSDLVRWPLLLTYGGVYADVGLMQIGDLDKLWDTTVGDPDSPWEVLSYTSASPGKYDLMNYFFACLPHNPLFGRCHRLLMKMWEGKTNTEGMHAHPLLSGMGMMMEDSDTLMIRDEEKGVQLGPREVSKMLTDYIIQGQVNTLVMSLVDAEDGWNGPEYAARHCYAIEYGEGSQLINEMTNWNGAEAFKLMSLPLPKAGQEESEEQKRAGDIVTACLQRSFGFKLAHGIILRVYGDTLGSLWRKHEGSDDVPGTYAHWLRYGMVHWIQGKLPPRVEFGVYPPVKTGRLLEVD